MSCTKAAGRSLEIIYEGTLLIIHKVCINIVTVTNPMIQAAGNML